MKLEEVWNDFPPGLVDQEQLVPEHLKIQPQISEKLLVLSVVRRKHKITSGVSAENTEALAPF